jgi:hypothetical protein
MKSRYEPIQSSGSDPELAEWPVNDSKSWRKASELSVALCVLAERYVDVGPDGGRRNLGSRGYRDKGMKFRTTSLSAKGLI